MIGSARGGLRDRRPLSDRRRPGGGGAHALGEASPTRKSNLFEISRRHLYHDRTHERRRRKSYDRQEAVKARYKGVGILNLGDTSLDKPPLVSVIVLNYNYSMYVEEAVLSVLGQTYPNVECIIIDDCSTDKSHEIIACLSKRYENLKYYSNPINSGQSVSCLNGFVKSAGDYIVFLDADDYLLPRCVEAHVRCHLSLRVAVGLTSVDMLQLCNGRIVTTTSQGFSEFTKSRIGIQKHLSRDGKFRLGESCSASEASIEKNRVHYVAPKFVSKWPWSPTSGNCFRRDALDIIIDNKAFPALRACTDIYLLRGVASLSGSVLIDYPLAVYRIHGKNAFIKSAPLHRMRAFDTKYLETHSGIAMTMIIDHIVENFELLLTRAESPYYLLEALRVLDDVWPPITKKQFAPSYLGQILIDQRERFVTALGVSIYYRFFFERLVTRLFRSVFYEENLFSILSIIVATPVLWTVSLLISFLWKSRPLAKEETEKPMRGSQSS